MLLERIFLISAAFGFVFFNLALFLGRNLTFNLGWGRYCGFFPLLGSFIGTIFVYRAPLSPAYQPIFWGFIALGIIGFIRDYKKISYAIIIPYALFVSLFALVFMGFFTGFSDLFLSLCWISLLIFCLKLSSLVYEMPFILLCMTSLTILLYFFQNQPVSHLSTLLAVSLFITSFTLLLLSNTKSPPSPLKNRYLLGSSGVFAAGFLLGCLTLLEKSRMLVLLGLCIPSMVIGFPFIFICGMIIISYFGNKLHVPALDADKRPYVWSLKREKTVLFTALIFLCINFALLISSVKTTVIGMFCLLLLLSLAIAGFLKVFMHKKIPSEAPTDTVEIFGINIASVSQSEVIAQIDTFVKKSDFCHIITSDSLALVRAVDSPSFKNIMGRAELVIPDGAGVVWAADFLGVPLKGRVPGVALVEEICRESVSRNWSLYFLGGKPGVVEKAADYLQEEHALNICGMQHGYFIENSIVEDEVIQNILNAKPNIVLVALGVPRQEHFITKLRNHGIKCVAIGVGGSFDVISKQFPRAPIFMQRFALEWLFRLYLEPRRFFRMLNIPVFVLRVMQQKWSNQT